MPQRTKAQKEAGVCVSGKHMWVDGQIQCQPCKDEWLDANKERRYAQIAEWAKNNPEKVREKKKRWRKNNPEKAKESDRKAGLKRKYGLTPKDIPVCCEVCGGDNGDRAICVDHDHETGEVRGFLCTNCNIILGHAKDDPALLEKLVLYIRAKK